tara:strand:- start:1220 stop:1489 length:270 start_codon:yes stop_codon:yes gene_type:complete
MESKKSTSSIVERFANLGTEDISAEQSAEVSDILEVFAKYPSKYFTQKTFVTVTEKSGPWINKILNKLLKDGKVIRERRQNKFWYQIAQ